MIKGYIKNLLRSSQTVYSFKELALMWPESSASTIKSRIHYYVKTNELYHIRRGLYAKDKDYNRFEVATKIYLPAYISFETVMKQAGIIFQHYTDIYVASYQSKTVVCDNQVYVFRTIKPSILLHPMGIEQKETYSIACPERAYLDMLYIQPKFYIDNPASFDWKKIFEILPIYEHKEMETQVKIQYTLYKKSLGT